MERVINQRSRFLLICIIISHCSTGTVGSTPQVPAMFVFGDSLVDNGNNNYLNSLAKANYWPHGIDFYKGPTGRFCNGKTMVDLLGEFLGLPDIPAFEEARTPESILNGVNYASAAGGILEETGLNYGGRISFSQQVTNFEYTLDQLKIQMEEEILTRYLAKSMINVIIGSNDYINNYLMPSFYPTMYYHKPEDYADILINRYDKYITALYEKGLRKFFLTGIGPLGCIPRQLANNINMTDECVSYVNEIVGMFNARLVSLVKRLSVNHADAMFVYGNTYGAFGDILNNPLTYGFKVTRKGCCGMGRNQGQITCLPLQVPCAHRNEYVFWDAFHPTEAVNAILARKAYIDVQQMIPI